LPSAGIFLKKTIPACGLSVFPKTGHTLNLEDTAAFNALLAEFVAQVEAGRWLPRDPRALPGPDHAHQINRWRSSP
jgi:hypothetical protein